MDGCNGKDADTVQSADDDSAGGQQAFSDSDQERGEDGGEDKDKDEDGNEGEGEGEGENESGSDGEATVEESSLDTT